MSGPFAKTTFGPPAPTGQDGDKGALLADVASGIVDMVDQDGNTHGLETTLLLLQAQTALTTITTAQNLFSKALKAGALNKSGRTLRITGTVIFTTTNATQFTIALTLGGVTLVSIQSAIGAAAITNGQISFELIVSVAATGSNGTLEAHGLLNCQLSGTLSTALPQYADQNTAVSSAVNLTSALTLACTIAASASVSSAQVRQVLVEVIN